MTVSRFLRLARGERRTLSSDLISSLIVWMEYLSYSYLPELG